DDGWTPSQLPILAAIAAHTQRIRIGTFVILLPFHNPIRVAEDAATVDIISGGRFDLGVGPGSDPNDYRVFGVPMNQRRPRMHEGLQVIRKCFDEEEFSFAGKYWNFERVRIDPKSGAEADEYLGRREFTARDRRSGHKRISPRLRSSQAAAGLV